MCVGDLSLNPVPVNPNLHLWVRLERYFLLSFSHRRRSTERKGGRKRGKGIKGKKTPVSGLAEGITSLGLKTALSRSLRHRPFHCSLGRSWGGGGGLNTVFPCSAFPVVVSVSGHHFFFFFLTQKCLPVFQS